MVLPSYYLLIIHLLHPYYHVVSELYSKVLPYCFCIVIVFSDTKFMVEGLVDDVEYEFRVTGVNRAGAGNPSTVSNAVLAKDPISESLSFFPSSNIYVRTLTRLLCRRSSWPGEEPVCV